MVKFDALPKDKPSQNNVTDGRQTATIFEAKMVASKTTPGTEYLNVSFKVDGGFVNENYFDSDKPFLLYKLGRLLKACKVELAGEGSLRDVAKVVKGKKVVIDVVINDRGYGALDYSGINEGVYAPEEFETVAGSTVAPTLEESIGEAIDTDVALLDEDF